MATYDLGVGVGGNKPVICDGAVCLGNLLKFRYRDSGTIAKIQGTLPWGLRDISAEPAITDCVSANVTTGSTVWIYGEGARLDFRPQSRLPVARAGGDRRGLNRAR